MKSTVHEVGVGLVERLGTIKSHDVSSSRICQRRIIDVCKHGPQMV